MKNQFRPQRFMRAIAALGPNDAARGKAIAASHRTAQRLREGIIPKSLVIIMRNPQLLDALIEDINNPTSDTDQRQAA